MTHIDSGSLAAATLLLPLIAPLAVALAAWLLGWSRGIAWSTTVAACAVLGTGVVAAARTTAGTILEVAGTLRADALSAVMLLVIGTVAVIATWAGRYSLAEELAGGGTDRSGARRYSVLVPLFLAAMVLAVLASNLGVLWAAIAATTVITAFLVGHHRTSRSLEATWKYVVICSVGLAIAYLGTVLVYFTATRAGLDGADALDWVQLSTRAGELNEGVMRIAFALLVVGFGTKAGLVPLHSWLPDAHSQAPAPISALMSGVLLAVGVYAVLRYHAVVAGALSPTYVRTLLLTVAIASLTVAALLLVSQRDYKRLLAYSSMEHMALCFVGVAVGTKLAVAAVLLHCLGHGLGKAVLFCSSGRILALTGSSAVDDVRGLLSRDRYLGAVFGLGLVALVGLPPFSLFASEVGLARATASAGLGWVVAVVLALLLVAFAAIAVRVAPMLLGRSVPTGGSGPGAGLERSARSLEPADAPLLAGLAALALIGMVSWPLASLLDVASGTVAR